MQTLKVWLDDERRMPEGYNVHVRTAESAIALLKLNIVSEISLDNDLGYKHSEGRKVADFIEQAARNEELQKLTCYIHTGDAIARHNMAMAIERAYAYWEMARGRQNEGNPD